jgi:hypothetical protein
VTNAVPAMVYPDFTAVGEDAHATYFVDPSATSIDDKPAAPYGNHLFALPHGRRHAKPIVLADLPESFEARMALDATSVFVALHSKVVSVSKTGGTPTTLIESTTLVRDLFCSAEVPYAVRDRDVVRLLPTASIVVHANAPITAAARLSDGTWAWCTAHAVYTSK